MQPPRLDHESFVLENGLTVIVQQDRRAPIVATNLWYGVGSKDEPSGRTGFAHLFEHLFFNASENRREDWHFLLNELGGIDVNGSTSRDRTNYYQTVSVSALDLVLWMEADRMGRLLPAIDQASLDREVMVVKNEKMQRESGPLGLLQESELRALYGDAHPYGHPVTGAMEDLERVSLDTVESWYRSWYGPGNAVLSLVGDIAPEEGRAAAERAFGGIAAGSPVRRVLTAIPVSPQASRAAYQTRAPIAGLRQTWLTSADAGRDGPLLQLAAQMLSGDATSRLRRRLVERDALVTDVNVRQLSQALSGEFSIAIQAKPDAPIGRIEQAIAEELDAFLQDGVDEAELARARRVLALGSASALQGLGARADCLSMGHTLHGRPDAALEACRTVEEATAAQVLDTARRWLSGPSLSLEITPFRGVSGESRPPVPRPSVPPPVMPTFPAIEERRLANGLTIVHARRPSEMSVKMSLVVDGGRASEPVGKGGVATLALNLLDRETRNRTRDQITADSYDLGASMGTSVSTDVVAVNLSVLADNWVPGLELMFDMVRRPTFPKADFDRTVIAETAALRSAQHRPAAIVERELGDRLFGPGHPYANRITPDSLAALTLDDIRGWHAAAMRPDKATLFAVGDFDIEVLASAVERIAGDWRPAGPAAAPCSTPIPFTAGRHRLRIDDVEQAIVAAALPIGASSQDDAALYFVTTILGGDTSGRLFRRLREEKGWTYSVSSFLSETRSGRWLRLGFSVQADATEAALEELMRVMEETRAGLPITAAELADAKAQVLRSLPSIWAENAAVLDAMVGYASTGRPLSAIGLMPERIAAVTLEHVHRVARQWLDPQRLILVVGEPAAATRALALG
ncbi:pitrilysin family protein [Novosphingobium sp. CF614]|uniref:M16 family metallopeptidase n=1 Tax=Novosphingobium sp. CF614 TaxID=1884364 RepID=UPI0015A6F2EE|nr:pitrilysin family protein [Novosphingobium sp. CF614]